MLVFRPPLFFFFPHSRTHALTHLTSTRLNSHNPSKVGTVPPHDLRYTSEYNGGLLSQIDHVLISEGLKGRLQSVSNAHLYPEGTISDHWPVVIDISTA